MINIGKVVYTIARDLVGNRVFPLIAEQGTDTPFIIYRRQVALPQDSKDAYVFKYRHTVEIRVVTDKYDDGLELVSRLADAFDHLRGRVDDINISETKIYSLGELYIDNSYVQILTVTIDTI